jgi:membrane-bound lytic murein transglycosylase D
MNAHRLLWLWLFFPVLRADAILPLPYPLEPPDEELASTEGPQRDPKSVAGYFELYQGSRLREMELPTFGDQKGALGYDPETFTVPPRLRRRVEFWKRIFTEFTSDQMVLHDSQDPSIIYEAVDVSQFTKDEKLTERARRRRLSRFLKPIRKRIADNLMFLQENQGDPLKIPLELFPIFQRFDDKSDPQRYEKASKRVRAQVGQRDRLVRGLFFGGRYFARMMEIFEKKGMPKELTRLPLVESSFNLAARSKVGASGVWQFMRTTGQLYLRIDKAVDERNDPITASWAAAELLASNFKKLNSWPLAITAYNHGPEGMARAVAELGSDSMADIIDRYESRTFGFASANFYAEFLAVLEVEKEYRTHFGKLLVDTPIAFDEFPVVDNVGFHEMSEACGVKVEEMAILNPALTDWVVSGQGFIPQGYRMKVPPGKTEKCRSGYRNVSKIEPDEERTLSSLPSEQLRNAK